MLSTHAQLAPELERAGADLVRVLIAAIDTHQLKVHSVSMRVKTADSLAGKLARPDKTYRDLWDVTDLVGLRVITYFDGDVPTIGRLIERHFDVDYQNSVDKRHDPEVPRGLPGRAVGSAEGAGDAPRFGYRSVHYICRLPGFTANIPPRFEIQVRTVLEHAWAEIEHDLGYKARDVMPAPARRRLHRLAGLLELADQEFTAIRKDLVDYASNLPHRLAAAEDIPLDLVSLDGLLALPECEGLDRAVAAVLERPFTAVRFYPDYLLRMLRSVGYENVGEVRAHLVGEHAAIVRLAAPYFDFAHRTWNLSPDPLCGYALLLLAHWRVLTNAPLDLDRVRRLTTLYRELDHPHDEREAQRIASQLFEAFRDHGVLPT